MTLPDYIVLILYFAAMMGIGFWSMRRIKAQEDYFMGGRSFGKLMQTFAAFGAGTGAADPVNTARTSFTSGMSGMWSVMSWLFVTPFYWITGVWYRRMRHMTLGDWFVERYESRAMGAAYTVFGLIFYMVYTSMMFSAIGKVAAPLIGDAVAVGDKSIPLEYVLVPLIAVIVMIYGIMGGVRAAYITDVIQGIFIILLSIVLIPFGLDALVEKFGNPAQDGMMDGFRIIHEQLPSSLFTIVGSSHASEFPIHRIVAITVISLIGIAVQPHFIATGGGTAKSEFNARVGLVTGNLAKRFCTVGWALTALIVLALFADHPELTADPDKAWGIASRELLWPGLRGLMMACLLAALMSSVDCYMIVSSALVVRNIYAPYFRANASEKEYLLVGRIAGAVIVAGAVLFSWSMMDVFGQLQLTWIVPMLFAAPFWVGMIWRRATKAAAWTTFGFTGLVFFLLPWILPLAAPSLKTHPTFTKTNHIRVTTIHRQAAPSDVRQREARIQAWEEDDRQIRQELSGEAREEALDALGPRPEPIQEGDPITETLESGGKPIYWSGAVMPAGDPSFQILRTERSGDKTVVFKQHEGPLRATGNFRLDFLLYDLFGMDLRSKSDALLATLELPPKIIAPFVLMILVSFLTSPNSRRGLDRFYVKMKTPVDPTPEIDRETLNASYENPARFDHLKLLPKSDIEIMKPRPVDVIGFLLAFAACFAVIGLAVWLAQIGA